MAGPLAYIYCSLKYALTIGIPLPVSKGNPPILYLFARFYTEEDTFVDIVFLLL